MSASALEETVEEPQAAPQTATRSIALNRWLVITGLILATALSALDSTIVATAMPSIVGVLGGLPLYSLVVAAFLLTATTTVPLFGKLSDIYGRKPVFMFGSGVFILGSTLCGLAWDMPSLIGFRAVQGLGAGALVPISLTIIGDVFEVDERARLQGVFGAVWGVSSVIGPLVGGTIVQFFDWRWVFFINIPVGIVSAFLLYTYLREPAIHTRQKVDIAGAILLTLGVGAVLVGLQEGSREGWLSPAALISWVGAAILLIVFGLVERRAPAPVLSLELLRRPVIAVPCLGGTLAGGVLVGFVTYIPLLVQGAWGSSPMEAGLVVAPLSIGWPLASSMSGRLLRKRVPYRTLALGGTSIIVAGALLLLSVQLPFVSGNGVVRVLDMIVAGFIAGVGLGLSTTAMLIAVQISVPWSERGIATASVQFFRNMGQSVGAALLGAVLTATLIPALASPNIQSLLTGIPATTPRAGADPALGPVNVLFDLSVRDTIPSTLRAALSSALSESLTWVYLGVVLMAVAGAVILTRFPHQVRET